MPVASISLVPFAGRPRSPIGTLGKPTLATSLMRSCAITMSTGPRGGAPVPSITVDAAKDEAVVRTIALTGAPFGGGLHLLCRQGDREDAREGRGRQGTEREGVGHGDVVYGDWTGATGQVRRVRRVR